MRSANNLLPTANINALDSCLICSSPSCSKPLFQGSARTAQILIIAFFLAVHKSAFVFAQHHTTHSAFLDDGKDLDWQLLIAAKSKSCRIHHLEIALDHLIKGDVVIELSIRVLNRIFGKATIFIVAFSFWGGSSFGGKPFFRKRTVFPRPPFPKKLSLSYTLFYCYFISRTGYILFRQNNLHRFISF